MLLADDDNANITANNQRVIINDPGAYLPRQVGPHHRHDGAAERWLVALDFGAVIEVKGEHFCFAPH